jgi:glycosyltransferase involved in cell wall biosynthesis
MPGFTAVIPQGLLFAKASTLVSSFTLVVLVRTRTFLALNAFGELVNQPKFLEIQPNASLVLLYQAAAALLLPSVVEGFGLSAVEAARCGTPAIVTRVGACALKTFKGR